MHIGNLDFGLLLLDVIGSIFFDMIPVALILSIHMRNFNTTRAARYNSYISEPDSTDILEDMHRTRDILDDDSNTRDTIDDTLGLKDRDDDKSDEDSRKDSSASLSPSNLLNASKRCQIKVDK